MKEAETHFAHALRCNICASRLAKRVLVATRYISVQMKQFPVVSRMNSHGTEYDVRDYNFTDLEWNNGKTWSSNIKRR